VVYGAGKFLWQWGATKPEHDSTSWRSYRPKGEIPEMPA
jgi:hypothetical protein